MAVWAVSFFFVHDFILFVMYISDYAHFTFSYTIWPLSLSSNFRTEMKPQAETLWYAGTSLGMERHNTRYLGGSGNTGDWSCFSKAFHIYLWYVLKSLRWPPIQRLVDDHWLLLRKLLPGGKNSVFPTAVGKLFFTKWNLLTIIIQIKVKRL